MDPLILHHFNVLGISPTTDVNTIKAAHTRKVKLFHPDKSGSDSTAGAFRAVQEAWEALRACCLNASDIARHNQSSTEENADYGEIQRLHRLVKKQQNEIDELKRSHIDRFHYQTILDSNVVLKKEVAERRSIIAAMSKELDELKSSSIDRNHHMAVLAENMRTMAENKLLKEKLAEQQSTIVTQEKELNKFIGATDVQTENSK